MKDVGTTVAGGCLGLIIASMIMFVIMIPLSLMWGWVWGTTYDVLIVPMLSQYGVTAVDIPYGHWVCAYFIMGIFRSSVVRKNPELNTWKAALEFTFTRVVTSLCILFVAWVVSFIFI